MTDDQFTKLEKYLDERFDLMEQRFDFTERYMRERFSEVSSEIKEVRDSIDQLRNTVDGIAGHLDTVQTEFIANAHSTDRRLDQHEGWITRLADHSQVKLEPQL